MRRLSREEFDRLNLDERMAYLQALMAELQLKLVETRAQAQQTGDALRRLEGGARTPRMWHEVRPGVIRLVDFAARRR
jgi:hypothetical protein